MARCQIGPKNCFVNNVVLLDEFDHFGQTFDDINVNIDSLTLDRSYEGCRNTNFQPYNQKILVYLANSNSYPFLSIIHHNHFLITKMFAKKKSAAATICDSFLWMT
jgi:hypothetical protein